MQRRMQYHFLSFALALIIATVAAAAGPWWLALIVIPLIAWPVYDQDKQLRRRAR